MSQNSTTDSEKKYFYGLGRRKASTARAKYYPGAKELEIEVNKKPIKDFFPEFFAQKLLTPLSQIGVTTGKFEIFVRGGGLTGQAEASRLAVSKAMLSFDENLKVVLRMHGYLTTDIRKVLPKITGLRKNRKREQWSKR